MKGYGHISRIWLPFAVLGIAQALWKGRFSAYRNTLVILLVARGIGAGGHRHHARAGMPLSRRCC